MRRHERTDEQWERLTPLLPPEKWATGRPNKDHHTILDASLWILRTAAPWRGLPERYGPWKPSPAAPAGLGRLGPDLDRPRGRGGP